jgi:nitrogen fixation NifU-like protein
LELLEQSLEGVQFARCEPLQYRRWLLYQFPFSLSYIRLLEGGSDGFMFLWPGPSRAAIYNFSCMYSAQLLDHFQNPRNAGDVADADAMAEINNPACGDILRLSLKIKNGRITEIGFKAKGCVPSMACASAITELVLRKTVEEARKVRPDDVISAVGGLPQASAHAPQLALDALSGALNNFASRSHLKAAD